MAGWFNLLSARLKGHKSPFCARGFDQSSPNAMRPRLARKIKEALPYRVAISSCRDEAKRNTVSGEACRSLHNAKRQMAKIDSAPAADMPDT
jgi:hypothetical protein